MKPSTKPYARPSRLPTGDPKPDQIYYAVGLALTTWELLEREQARLFSVLVNDRSGAAERAYGVVMPTRLKKEMIIQAAKTGLQPSEMKEVSEAVQATEGWSDLRNDIAHGVATLHETDEAPLHYYLMPPSYASKKVDFLSEKLDREGSQIHDAYAYAYTAAQILDIAIGFERHREILRALWLRIFMDRKKQYGR